MKVTQLNFVKFYMLLVVGLTASAFASCGDSVSALEAGATAITRHASPMPEDSQSSPGAASSSIVGLWYVQFKVDGNTIQEAYQLWNAGGTEVHNPNVDPRTGSVCLGVWDQDSSTGAYRLVHRVWSYDANGNFLGTIHLKENLTLQDGGNKLSGWFTLRIYDPSGVFQHEVPGHVTGRRISVE